MADNPITVPLPQDLPQNWTYGQTIGPQGTDVGLTQQHGYNYLMQQVNAAQQAAQELGAAFHNLYGEGDIVPATGGGTGAEDTQNALANLGAGVRENLVHNGCFDIWQKGTSFDFSGGGNQTGPDRWSNNYQQVKYERATNTSPADCQWMLKVTNMSSTGADSDGSVVQVIEGLNAEDQITVSFFAQSLKGKIQMSSNNAAFTEVGEEWSLVSFTMIARDQRVIISARLGSDLSAGYNITSIKVEKGPTQTNAYKDSNNQWKSLSTPKLSEEWSNCLRYFRRIPEKSFLGGKQNVYALFEMTLLPPMVKTPVLTIQGEDDLSDSIDDGVSTLTPTGITKRNIQADHVDFFFSGIPSDAQPTFFLNRYIDISTGE